MGIDSEAVAFTGLDHRPGRPCLGAPTLVGILGNADFSPRLVAASPAETMIKAHSPNRGPEALPIPKFAPGAALPREDTFCLGDSVVILRNGF